MAPTAKHGGHRLALDLQALAAGTASDTSEMLTYDYLYTTYGVYDSTSEYVLRATAVFAANVTGQATDFFSVQLTHYNVSGSVVDRVTPTTLVFNAGGVTATAYVPIDVTAAAASTGNTIAQGWKLAPGDTIELKRVSSTATGLASPAMAVTFLIGVNS
jgi:hypothetical protein